MWQEYFSYGVSRTLRPGTGVVFETIPIRIDSDADFMFQKTTFVATDDRIKVRYKDDSVGRYIVKGNLDIKTIAGRNMLVPMGLSNSFIPFVWTRPYVISAGTNFIVEAADHSGVANTLHLVFHGSKVRPGQAPWSRRFRAVIPFVYTFVGGAITIAANLSAVFRIETDMDSHFVVQKITGIRSGGALVSISEGGRDREWSNVPIHIDNLCGNGAFPNILPSNRFIQRGSVISFTIQNLTAAPNTIEICLVGTKLYE
ncbi:MAG: hypothetical protein DDT18_01704 [Actinobacteria bacterium]|nr:hypothetical protein [Actinomycetota bacterium]